jgi:hypothetical protein
MTHAQVWIDTLQALLTPTIAIVTTYIAWQQWQGNKVTLRLERYERRLSVYRAVVKFITAVVTDSNFQTRAFFDLRSEAAEADFLFNSEIPGYIEELVDRAVKLTTANKQYRDSTQQPTPGYDHSAVVNAMHEQNMWFAIQLPVAKLKFKSYLSVNKP